MADDVQPQQEGMRTLHLRLLRIQWQVVTLQVISTIALLWMYLKMVDLYIVDSIDHALAIEFFDTQLRTANLEMPLPAWLTGEDAIGLDVTPFDACSDKVISRLMDLLRSEIFIGTHHVKYNQMWFKLLFTAILLRSKLPEFLPIRGTPSIKIVI